MRLQKQDSRRCGKGEQQPRIPGCQRMKQADSQRGSAQGIETVTAPEEHGPHQIENLHDHTALYGKAKAGEQRKHHNHEDADPAAHKAMGTPEQT